MASIRLNSKTTRQGLKPRHPQYWSELDRGIHLGYRKSATGGTWYVRRFVDGKYIVRRIGLADDNQPADGRTVLNHTQARRKATEYEDILETFEPPKRQALFTVTNAVREYLEWSKANSKGYQQTKTVCEGHIMPALGNVPVATLRKRQIDKWVTQIATSPPRTPKGHPKPPYSVKRDTGKRTKGKGRIVYEFIPLPYEEWTAEMKRKRKSTANRILTVLKAALNHAWANGRVDDPSEWKKAKPFKGADAAKVKYLTEEEAAELVACASDDFRPMAKAALLTGCRYGELCQLRVEDFSGGQVHIGESKTGKPRHVPLSPEGVKFFKALAEGKVKSDLLITHRDGSAWSRSHQTRPMREACEAAAIEPVGFHILRHTYATLLLRSANGSGGMSIHDVAKLIGDSVATCEKHYGHVIQDDLAKEVARKLPSFGGTS